MADIPVNSKEGRVLEKDLPHNIGNPVRDIYGPPGGQHRPIVQRENDNVTLRPASKTPGWPRGPRES
jgi:hypothetical protein